MDPLPISFWSMPAPTPVPTPHWVVTILSAAAAIVGMVLGTAGFVMSLINYLRDRPRAKVFLKWDTALVGDASKQMGIVRVTNVGRRPIYISVAALQVPKGYRYSHLILKESMPGKKLSEGDAPATFLVN